MRSLAAVVLLAAPLVALADNLPYKSDSSSFRIRFPAPPEMEGKELAVGADRTVPIWSHRASDPKSHALFSVTVAEYPPAFAELSREVILDGVRDGLKGKDGRIKRDERKNGERFVQIEAGRNVVHARLVLVGSKLFQVTVAGPSRGFPDKLAREFLDAFESVNAP